MYQCANEPNYMPKRVSVRSLAHWLIGELAHWVYKVIFGFKYVYKISTTRFVKTNVIA